jgi:hypothetical protein
VPSARAFAFMILHEQEHHFYVYQPQLLFARPSVLLQRPALASRDLILLEQAFGLKKKPASP